MSVAKLAQATNRWAGLVKTLKREMQSPQGGLTEPIIIEHRPAEALGRLRVYVIWERWKDIPQVEGARIIKEAYDQAHSAFDFKDVFSTIGLTAEEAGRLGIHYVEATT
jgi:hypothetical protein